MSEPRIDALAPAAVVDFQSARQPEQFVQPVSGGEDTVAGRVRQTLQPLQLCVARDSLFGCQRTSGNGTPEVIKDALAAFGVAGDHGLTCFFDKI